MVKEVPPPPLAVLSSFSSFETARIVSNVTSGYQEVDLLTSKDLYDSGEHDERFGDDSPLFTENSVRRWAAWSVGFCLRKSQLESSPAI
jgi:hypothetical protein